MAMIPTISNIQKNKSEKNLFFMTNLQIKDKIIRNKLIEPRIIALVFIQDFSFISSICKLYSSRKGGK